MSVMNCDLELLELLLRHGVPVNQRAVGYFFMPVVMKRELQTEQEKEKQESDIRGEKWKNRKLRKR